MCVGSARQIIYPLLANTKFINGQKTFCAQIVMETIRQRMPSALSYRNKLKWS